jgi:carboxypeptidase C (cathepsin A)
VTSLLRFLLLPLCIVLLISSAQAQDASDPKGKAKPAASVPDQQVQTKHKLKLKDRTLSYTATAGTLTLQNDKGKDRGHMFFVAYTLDDAKSENRPITFAFNGGPGSSSVWLHLGVLGPKRVLMQEDGHPTAPPYRLVDNEYSLLAVSDLVFIDPITTGFSRPAEGQEAKQFHGVQQDIESVGEFVRLYLTRNQRWGSPKFLAGESYGTTRAAGLANHLQNRHGINLNGIVLVSAVLNFQTIRFNEGNDLPYILFLPAYTATAWYHKKLGDAGADLVQTLKKAEAFAQGEYTLALMKGSQLTKKEREDIAARVASFTGLSKEYVLQNNLRIPASRFFRELLREERLTVGRFDSRFTGKDGDVARETPEYDPSYAVVQGAYTASLNQYLRAELGYKSDLVYEILTGQVQPWDYGSAKNRYLTVTENLRSAMTQNPHLKIFVANGYYDLATPYFATEYTFHHLGIDPSLEKNIRMGYYEAGHMMYIQMQSLRAMHQDLTQFYDWSLKKP